MTRTLASSYAIATALFGIASSVLPQQPDKLTEIERLAVRTALDRNPYFPGASGRIVVNPMTVAEGHAPGVTGLQRRPDHRAEALFRTLNAKSLDRRDVFFCNGLKCELRGADVFVSLSEPRFEGPDVIVTVTVESVRASGRLYYETIHLKLSPAGSSWKVASLEQLGIS